MKNYRSVLAAMSLAAMTVQPAMAGAQTPRFNLPVSVGQSVKVRSADGRTVDGKVQSLTLMTMELEADGVRTAIAVDDVRRIRVHDSVGDGVAKGIALALPIALIRLLGDNQIKGFGGPYRANKSGSEAIVPMAAIVGAGGLIGGLIDSLRLTTIYQRESDGMAVSVRPLVSDAGKGLGIRLRW